MVRRARVADREAVWPLVLQIPRRSPERTAFDRSFGPLLGALDTFFAVAETPDEIVGYVLANRHLTFASNGPVTWVEEIVVTSDARRRGIGGQLLRAVEAWSGEHGAGRVTLATGLSKDFYRTNDYVEAAGYFAKDVAVVTGADPGAGSGSGADDSEAAWEPVADPA